MQGLFFIPETRQEIKELTEEIVERNSRGAGDVPKIDFFYALALIEAYYSPEGE